uniref:Chalcone/stilbene synthase N-terminal domain-containing protein n=1 Tax=Oryza brachyantha TaxID=4533 RepID=J3N1A5_ORYBR
MPGAATAAAAVDSRRGARHRHGPRCSPSARQTRQKWWVLQDEFTDSYYFGLTKSDHLTELKDKMKRIWRNILWKRLHLYDYPDILHSLTAFETKVNMIPQNTFLRKLYPHVLWCVRHCLHGCSGGGRALQLAKEIAENNRDARVLIALSELTLICFSSLDESKIVGHGLFGDGAGAIIVGAGPIDNGEHPLVEMVSASQTTIPGSDHILGMQAIKPRALV